MNTQACKAPKNTEEHNTGSAVATAVASRSNSDEVFFEFKGREWRIFLRGSQWSLRFEHNKKTIWHSLGPDKTAAIATAKIKIAAVLEGHLDVLKQTLKRARAGDSEAAPVVKLSTIGQVINAYETMPLDIDARTRHFNVNAFKLVLARVHLPELQAQSIKGQKNPARDAAVCALSSAVLNADTVRRWFELALVKARAMEEQEELSRVKRSANSLLNQARCLLQGNVLAGYARAGLSLPDLAKFNEAIEGDKFRKVTVQYHPPAEKIIQSTLAQWLTLPDRNMFIAVGLELSCGLRRSEVAQVVWGMFTKTPETALLDGRGWVKNQSGWFVVVPLDPFWSQLNARIDKEGWRGKGAELVLKGTPTDLKENIFAAVGKWMRGPELGWNMEKTNHALRAYSASLVAMKYGIYRASHWLRHASVKTTEDYYGHFINERVFTPELVPVSWAK